MLFSLFWRQRPQQFGLTRTIVLSVFHKRWDLNVFNLCAMKNLADLIVTRTQRKGFCGWGPIGYVSHFQLSLFSLRKNDSGCKLPFNKESFQLEKEIIFHIRFIILVQFIMFMSDLNNFLIQLFEKEGAFGIFLVCSTPVFLKQPCQMKEKKLGTSGVYTNQLNWVWSINVSFRLNDDKVKAWYVTKWLLAQIWCHGPFCMMKNDLG